LLLGCDALLHSSVIAGGFVFARTHRIRHRRVGCADDKTDALLAVVCIRFVRRCFSGGFPALFDSTQQ
jgi:hypothetical protein